MNKLSEMLARTLESLDSVQVLYVYGVDSLVELRNWFLQSPKVM